MNINPTNGLTEHGIYCELNEPSCLTYCFPIGTSWTTLKKLSQILISSYTSKKNNSSTVSSDANKSARNERQQEGHHQQQELTESTEVFDPHRRKINANLVGKISQETVRVTVY